MLIKDYYLINHMTKTGETAVFFITLRADSTVYEGHFPAEPISPGVCNIQMIKECAELVAGKPLLLNHLQQCRLTTLITPMKHSQVEVVLRLDEKEGTYRLKATLGKGADCYLELKAELSAEF